MIADYLFFNVKEYITPFQHGFYKGRSIETYLLELCYEICNNFSKNKSTVVAYFDFTKAFDRINHKILLLKLKKYGFCDNFICWLSSYLSGRTQRVKYNSKTSSDIHVLSGVPQGSHLGPILFLLFINDINNCIEFCNISLYADDTKLYHSCDDAISFNHFQRDIDNLTELCRLNDLEFNIKKCKTMIFSRKRSLPTFNFSINGIYLDAVNSISDLGVIFDSKLTFNNHISYIISKAKMRLASIKRWSKEFNDINLTKTLYTSLVRSILEFSCCVWSPYYTCHVQKLESVQKQFLLFLLYDFPWSNRFQLPKYEHRLSLINFVTLEDRRKMLCAMFVYKILTSKIKCSSLLCNIYIKTPLRSQRNFSILKLRYNPINYLYFEPNNRNCICFNELYNNIDFNQEICNVKKNICKHFKLLYRNL